MGPNYVDISEAITEAIAGCRGVAEQDKMLATDRWLGTLALIGHGEGDGISWVTLTDQFGMRWGYVWPWQETSVPGGSMEDMLIDAEAYSGEPIEMEPDYGRDCCLESVERSAVVRMHDPPGFEVCDYPLDNVADSVDGGVEIFLPVQKLAELWLLNRCDHVVPDVCLVA